MCIIPSLCYHSIAYFKKFNLYTSTWFMSIILALSRSQNGRVIFFKPTRKRICLQFIMSWHTLAYMVLPQPHKRGRVNIIILISKVRKWSMIKDIKQTVQIYWVLDLEWKHKSFNPKSFAFSHCKYAECLLLLKTFSWLIALLQKFLQGIRDSFRKFSSLTF